MLHKKHNSKTHQCGRKKDAEQDETTESFENQKTIRKSNIRLKVLQSSFCIYRIEDLHLPT